jgi:hypothetical protein
VRRRDLLAGLVGVTGAALTGTARPHASAASLARGLDHARKIDLRSVPTPERQARFCVDTARAWQRFGSPGNAFKARQVADRCAPEELRRSSVRSLVASLLDAPGRTPPGLQEFAARCAAHRHVTQAVT